jgi:GNAT superfamily N-acetyltransferase
MIFLESRKMTTVGALRRRVGISARSNRRVRQLEDRRQIDLTPSSGSVRHALKRYTAAMASAVIQAQTNAEYGAARALFQEYAAGLAIDLGFQGFAAELNQLQTMYGAPAGFLLLARGTDEFIGCIGVRRWSADSCEMKRLYVRDAARGSGLGRTLVLEAIQRARHAGYRRMLLDTLADMIAARALYSALGFLACEPYCHNPNPGTAFMALEL